MAHLGLDLSLLIPPRLGFCFSSLVREKNNCAYLPGSLAFRTSSPAFRRTSLGFLETSLVFSKSSLVLEKRKAIRAFLVGCYGAFRTGFVIAHTPKSHLECVSRFKSQPKFIIALRNALW